MLIVGAAGFGGSAHAHSHVTTVGGAPMHPTKNIVQNAVNSKDHTTLVAAVKAAGTVDILLKPENKGKLVQVLRRRTLVPGKLTAVELGRVVKAGGGEAAKPTVG